MTDAVTATTEPTAAPAQTTAADTATASAVEAHISGDKEKAAPLFNRARVEYERATAAAMTGRGLDDWRDGNEIAPLPPMPPAPTIEARVVSHAVNELSSHGEAGLSLMREWGGADSAGFAENIGYARQAVQEIAKTNPDILAFLSREQISDNGTKYRLGDDPKWVRLAAEHGRLRAGSLTADHNNTRNNEMSFNRSTPTAMPASSGSNRGSEETRTALSRLMRENPPGSDRYKDPDVQNRIQQLHRTIAGSGAPVGIGGRRA